MHDTRHDDTLRPAFHLLQLLDNNRLMLGAALCAIDYTQQAKIG